ncbi:hypothetical protein ACVWWN_007741 [Mycobacterium sp. URHB0021]|jgi:hypothetical protein
MIIAGAVSVDLSIISDANVTWMLADAGQCVSDGS